MYGSNVALILWVQLESPCRSPEHAGLQVLFLQRSLRPPASWRFSESPIRHRPSVSGKPCRTLALRDSKVNVWLLAPDLCSWKASRHMNTEIPKAVLLKRRFSGSMLVSGSGLINLQARERLLAGYVGAEDREREGLVSSNGEKYLARLKQWVWTMEELKRSRNRYHMCTPSSPT